MDAETSHYTQRSLMCSNIAKVLNDPARFPHSRLLARGADYLASMAAAYAFVSGNSPFRSPPSRSGLADLNFLGITLDFDAYADVVDKLDAWSQLDADLPARQREEMVRFFSARALAYATELHDALLVDGRDDE